MIARDTLHELFDYHYWARDRQLDACATLNQEQFLHPLESSFSSVRDTLAHLVGAEWLYLERWRGRPPRSMLPSEEFPTLQAVRERWREIERQLRDYLAGLSDRALGQPTHYTNLKGQAKTFLLWQTMYHLLNHQSYHRGQITTLLRMLGASPVPVDFYVYLDRQE
jgi:uncharacterized damage-inducible protein DinB